MCLCVWRHTYLSQKLTQFYIVFLTTLNSTGIIECRCPWRYPGGPVPHDTRDTRVDTRSLCCRTRHDPDATRPTSPSTSVLTVVGLPDTVVERRSVSGSLTSPKGQTPITYKIQGTGSVCRSFLKVTRWKEIYKDIKGLQNGVSMVMFYDLHLGTSKVL